MSFSAGVISLVDNPGLDFETQNTYDINCEYTDGLYTLTQTVTVTITDVNEPPYFVTTYYEDTYTDQFVSTSFGYLDICFVLLCIIVLLAVLGFDINDGLYCG